MKAGKYFTGKYMAKEDLEGKEHKVTISEVTQETIEDQHGNKEPKLIVFFEEFEKGMVLNKTNYEAILFYMGGDDETDHWLGKQGIVYVDNSIMFAGKRVGGLRIRFDSPAKNNGAISSDQMLKILDDAEGLGWKSSELKKAIKKKFGVDNIAHFPAEKVEDLYQMMNTGME